MATAHEWIAYDTAAQKVLGEMIGQCGYSYRQFAELSNGSMSYNRVRDIELGRRAPVKLSEFLLICDVCHADPVRTLREIIAEADRIAADRESRGRGDAEREARRRELAETAERESRLEEETLRRLEEDPLSLAAYHDPHKHDPQPDNAA